MTTYPEERVLRTLDPIPRDVNDWPDFALREVKIFYQGKGRYADLLEACADTPLCVLGELMPLDDEQEDLARIENPTHARIKIENVTHYSFGQDNTGKPIAWAAGKAGWYEIAPSDRYLSHYNDTIEAIDLFYFMVDQHQKLPKKKQKAGFQIDPFLMAYQKHTGYRIDDDDEAMETIHKHHKFLLKQMFEGREGIDWMETLLWHHLKETYVDEVEELRNAIAKLEVNGTAAISSDEESAAESEFESEADSSTASEDSSVPAAATEIESDSDESKELDVVSSADDSKESSSSDSEKEDDRDWTKTIWDLLNILRKTPTFDIRNCGIDQLASELQKLPIFTYNHKHALKAIEHSAEPLLRLMNEAKLRKKFNWSTRVIYAELEATLADEIAADVMKTPLAKKGRQRHRMKSVLRPSGASKARKRTRGVIDLDDEDEEMVDQPANSPTAKRQQQPQPAMLVNEVGPSRTSVLMEDSPSRQLNGNLYDLPELPPAPEAQEMLDLVAVEAKRVGRQHQTTNLEAFLGQWGV